MQSPHSTDIIKKKLRRMIVMCNLVGWAIIFYTIATIIFIKIDCATEHVPGIGGIAPFFYSVLGLIFVLTPLGGTVGSSTIKQIRQAKNHDIEITLSQAIFATLGMIFCFTPLAQIVVIVVLIWLF